jgi:ribosome-binding factor A
VAHRIERVNSLIRQEISELLQRQVKDPRLGNFIAVTEVNTSADLKHARVFISSMDEGGDKKEIMEALESATGFFRTRLAKNLRMRYTPEISFHWDESIKRGDRLLQLIDEIVHEDDI